MTQLPNNLTGLLNNPLLTPVGINPNAPMLSPQPMGGFGVPQNPMMGMPQQQKPTSFADRLKSLIPAFADYYRGASIAGKASLDPSSGDANFVNAMGLQNVQNQRRAREALANQLQQQQIANQISFMNQMTKDQKNFAYRESLPDDQKADFDKFISTSSFSGQPASVKEWQYYSGLTKDDQNKYLNMKRQGFRTIDTGAGFTVVNPQGDVVQDKTIQKTLPPTAQPENIVKKKEAEERGKELAELKIQFPKIQSEMKQKVTLIDDILGDPNLDDYLGGNALLPAYPGTAKSDFRAKLDMLKSQEFLTQFDKLRGTGQISNAEGERAVSAGTIISDKLSKEQLIAELKRLREVANNVSTRKFKQIESLSGNQSQTTPTNEIIQVRDEDLE
tara:strand:- start:401 stop:1567 length:1167 start_codon:yes stop_codon:yes gene_type:complete